LAAALQPALLSWKGVLACQMVCMKSYTTCDMLAAMLLHRILGPATWVKAALTSMQGNTLPMTSQNSGYIITQA